MRILHAGCGIDRLPAWLPGEEVRLDVEPKVKPDVVASITDMGEIGSFDVVYCAHALEHLYPQDVGIALGEFWRVLSPGGAVILFVPDVEDVRATEEVLYVSPSGPITGIDILYGFRPALQDFPHMAHHMGFTADTMTKALERAGFVGVVTQRCQTYNLLAGGRKP